MRHALALGERIYEALRDLRADERPAIAGGWPARLVPFPSPRPYGRRERRAIRRAIRRQSTSCADGDAIRRFEEELAARWQSRHAIAVSSGAAALHAALIAAEVGAGDEVIVPALAHASNAMTVLHEGARPVFVDADPRAWNVDPLGIEAAVNERTKAIVAVHLCGVPCDMRRILAIADAHGLAVIEDASQAHGARFDGRPLGTLGRLGCLSFQSTKTLTTGEGGVVLTDDDGLARRVRLAINFGEVRRASDPGRAARVDYELAGWNYRMSALQAALGIGQLERSDELYEHRNRNAARLWRGLAPIGGLECQHVPAGGTPCYSHFYVLLPEVGRARDELCRALARERVDFRLPYERPLPSHAIFADSGSYPVAEEICRRALGFRVDPGLGAREMEAVAFAMRRLFAWR